MSTSPVRRPLSSLGRRHLYELQLLPGTPGNLAGYVVQIAGGLSILIRVGERREVHVANDPRLILFTLHTRRPGEKRDGKEHQHNNAEQRMPQRLLPCARQPVTGRP